MRLRRRRKPEPVPWDFDWRNPDMKVMRRPWVEDAFGQFRPVNTVMTAEQSSRLSREGVSNPDFPDWDRDPSYQWGKKKRLADKRRRKQHRAALEAAKEAKDAAD